MRTFAEQGYRKSCANAFLLKRAIARGEPRIENILVGERGRIINLHGYDWVWHHDERYCLFLTKPIFEFTLHDPLPITFEDHNYDLWRPNRHGFSDGGSIPIVGQVFISPFSYLPIYIFHDDSCKNGGLWCLRYGDTEWRFVKLGRGARDDMLDDMAEVCGMGIIKRSVVHIGVRSFAFVTHQWD